MQQRMALPASALIHLLPDGISTDVEVGQVEFLLRKAHDILETSQGMFKWQKSKNHLGAPLLTEDLNSGASIAKMVLRYPPLPDEIRRLKFKRLAAIGRLKEFSYREDARETITSSVDRLIPKVLEREGWRLTDAVAYATNGSSVQLGLDKEENRQAERYELLTGIFALDLLGEFNTTHKLQ